MLELYAIADGRAEPGLDDPAVVICMDEFGPLNLMPHPGKQWAPQASGKGQQDTPRRRRRRATYNRPHGVRHLMAGYDLSRDKLYGHVTTRKGRVEFLTFCRYLRSLHPKQIRLAIVLDNFSPHRCTKTDARVGKVGLGQQRRTRLRPLLRFVAEPRLEIFGIITGRPSAAAPSSASKTSPGPSAPSSTAGTNTAHPSSGPNPPTNYSTTAAQVKEPRSRDTRS